MNETAKINLGDLKRAVDALFEHVQKGGVTQLVLKRDYYWEIDGEDLYDVGKNPAALSIGSLYADWDFLGQIGDGKSEPVVLNFQKAAALLRFLGESIQEEELTSPPPR